MIYNKNLSLFTTTAVFALTLCMAPATNVWAMNTQLTNEDAASDTDDANKTIVIGSAGATPLQGQENRRVRSPLTSLSKDVHNASVTRRLTYQTPLKLREEKEALPGYVNEVLRTPVALADFVDDDGEGDEEHVREMADLVHQAKLDFYKEQLAEAKDTKKQFADLAGELAEGLAQVSSERSSLQVQVYDLEMRKGLVENELETTKADKERVEKDNAALTLKQTQLTEQLAALEVDKQAKAQALEDMTAQKGQADQENAELTSQRRALEQQLVALNSEKQAREQELVQMTEQKTQADQANSELALKEKTLTEQLAALAEEKSARERDLSTRTQDLSAREQALADMTAKKEEAETNYQRALELNALFKTELEKERAAKDAAAAEKAQALAAAQAAKRAKQQAELDKLRSSLAEETAKMRAESAASKEADSLVMQQMREKLARATQRSN